MRGIKNNYFTDNKLPSLDSWLLDPLADYSGTDRKDGLLDPDGRRYMIKYAEEHTRVNDLDTSYVNNVLSEYMSSHILGIIGFETHNTFLGTRKESLLVACENFTSEKEHLIEFGTFLRKHYDSHDVDRVLGYEQLQYVMKSDPLLREKAEEFMNAYWECAVGDAFVANSDRHKGNFGYLVNKMGEIRVSPIYDNGSTLFPALSEKDMIEEIMSSEKEVLKRTLLFPKMALKINGKKVSYKDVLSAGFDESINKAVLKIVPRIKDNLEQVYDFINAQEFLTDTRKNFYKMMLSARMKYVLEPALLCCEAKEYDPVAKKRLAEGIEYSEALFEEDYKLII